MPADADPREISRLYAALNERILAKDKEGTIEAYYKLLDAGRPLSEVVAWTEEVPPVSADTENLQPAPDPANLAPVAQPGLRSTATTWLSPMRTAAIMFAVGAVATVATLGVLLMRPPQQNFASVDLLARKAQPGAPVEMQKTAAPTGASPTTIGAAGAMATEKASTTESQPEAVAVPTPPPAVPAPSARLIPEVPEREAAAAVLMPAPTDAAAGPVRPASPIPASPPLPIPAVPAPPIPASLPVPMPASPAPPAPSAPPTAPAAKLLPDQPHLDAAEIAALLARGDNLLGAGDIASARLFYERATNAGDGRAALRLGATYDPGFLGLLNRLHLPEAYGDAAKALSWYRRAGDLGESEAGRWIEALETPPGR